MKITIAQLSLLCSLTLTFGCSLAKAPVMEPQNNAAAELSSSSTNSIDSEAASDIRVTLEQESGAAANNGKSAIVSPEDQNSEALKTENGEGEQTALDDALDLTDASQEFWEDGDVDKSIEALDQAYALILQVDPGNNAKLIQQKEDLRITISRRILELYASRYVTTNGNHKEIPLTMNEHVERELKSFQTVERDFFEESYKRSGKYRGGIAKAFKDAGLPEELSWLPLIESGFKVRALSRARALGLWQFIPSTGYKFGLKRNDWIDERLDPEKATAAAIAYLKELHQIFGDWATVLAAYNCGEGSVLRVIRSQKINYLDNFWDLYERLPRETARYFPRFLAVLTIIKDPAKYGFTLEQPEAPMPFEVVTIERPIHLKTMADKLGFPYEDICALNPELRRDATPNVPYALRVAPGTGAAILSGLDKLPKWSPPKVAYVVHRVRRGETLSLIAMKYRTSIQKIIEANNIRRVRLLRVGQKLKIPLKYSS